eukprot:TRINITY_DN18296_c0_g1_i1.p1 TRINITY_DN18296_c0_g1~~TRINITY_DN18296_c0_g1_i1.p1  ORF type:complete len:445 (+),score=144.00 TRINITY_DN18296_c0_g1_i1:101-1336(+)
MFQNGQNASMMQTGGMPMVPGAGTAPGAGAATGAAPGAAPGAVVPQEILMKIRQGVAAQDKPAVQLALQTAMQQGIAIEKPIMDMLRQWLGEATFTAIVSGSGQAKAKPAFPPVPPGSAAQQASQPPQPLVMIRQGVAAQDKNGVRNALRLALQQGTKIEAAVCSMLRQWLGEDDEALNALMQGTASKPEALAGSTAKASAQAPPGPAPVGPVAGAVAEPAAPLKQEEAAEEADPGESAPAPAPAKAAAPKQPLKAAPPVISRAPMLKGAAAPEPAPVPDIDASFDDFLSQLNEVEPPSDAQEATAEPASKKQKTDAEAAPPPPDDEDAPPPPPDEKPPPPEEPAKPKPKPPAPKAATIKKPPKITGPKKDEWGRDIAAEEDEKPKEAWEYMQERQESMLSQASFIDFNSF